MMQTREEYREFLRTAIEKSTVSFNTLFYILKMTWPVKSLCIIIRKHPAKTVFIMNALLASKACDITGVVVVACASMDVMSQTLLSISI